MAGEKATSTSPLALANVLENQALLAVLAGLTLAGGWLVAAKIFSFVRLLFSLFILPGKSLRSFGPPGSWAVVTGASDGIGAEFASQLAAAGYNVVLAARTASKLDALASRLEAEHSIHTHTLAIDFSAPTPAQDAALAALISPLDVAILINNVGQSHALPTPFALTPAAERDSIVAVNCASTLRTTALVLPGMRARRRGLVLTMGSFAGLLPTPLLATYSGSKAFLQHWSSALAAELAPHGVCVALVQSYLVTSAMSKVRRPTALVPTPRAFVRSALARIGRSGGAQGFAYSSTPYWSHALMQWALAATVGFTGQAVVGWNLSMHEEIRGKALRKMARERKTT